MNEERKVPDGTEPDAAGTEAGENARRRLVKGALAVGPVVLAMRGQSALAGTGCASPSAILSGNLSPGRTKPSCGTGWSPGYWKVCQHFGQWAAAGLVPPTFDKSCSSGMPKGNRTAEGTLFGQIPVFSNSGALSAIGAWRILAYPTMVDKELAAFNATQVQLARHLIATYLNARVVGSTFPLTDAQMRDMWEKGSLGNYCPAGSGCTSNQLWSAQTVVCYLRNYTMDQGSFAAYSDTVPWACGYI